MITYLQFIEELNSDDDPAKIYARAMIRDMKDNYQAIVDEFEKEYAPKEKV